MIDFDFLENILFFILIIIAFCCVFFLVDEHLARNENIIKNSKDYVVFEHCHSFDSNYYCWND